ncbi:Matrix metalloproteinase-14, partial [Armadillidium nasatum]
VWSDVTDLTFKASKTSEVDIDIRFELREHGDDGPFDGPGGVVAHAFLPFCGGDAHFDKSETWTIDSDKGNNTIRIKVVLVLYHCLYSSCIFNSLQSLYGEKTVGDKTHSASTPKIRSKPTESDSILCRDGSIDAIFTADINKIYVFKGVNFWVLSNEGIEKGYPKSISKEFPGLLPKIDAAYARSNGKTYFFKESMFWRFTGHTKDVSYPKEISKGFSGIPNNIDAAFVWSGNGKIYFFKGENYYKLDPIKRPYISTEYPKSITTWEGVPFYIDDAFQYSDGLTYFFKNGYYWRFNDQNFQVDVADPPYPREAGPRWFGCPAEDSHTITKSTTPFTINLLIIDLATSEKIILLTTNIPTKILATLVLLL